MFLIFALGIPALIRPTLHQFALRRGDLDSKQHRICRGFQYGKAGKAKDADSGLFFCQCSFQPLQFLNNMSVNEGPILIGLIPGRKQPGVGLFLAWSRLQSKPPNPNWYPKRQSHQSPLPGVRLQRFRIKNDHLLGESGTSKHQVLSRFIGSLRLMKRLLWSVLWCCVFSPRISVSNRMISHL